LTTLCLCRETESIVPQTFSHSVATAMQAKARKPLTIDK
jgi:hypothetical protein